MSDILQARTQRLQYLLGRMDRIDKAANALANPFDGLRDDFNFLKGAIAEYINNLQRDIDDKQKTIDNLELENNNLKMAHQKAIDALELEIADLKKKLEKGSNLKGGKENFAS